MYLPILNTTAFSHWLAIKIDDAYGGILIRGLYRESGEKRIRREDIIPKPGVVRNIFNSLEMGGNLIEIISTPTRWKRIFNTSRQNLGKGDGRYKNAWYRYIAKDEQLIQNFKGKEAIVKNSSIEPENWHLYLGYTGKS